MTIEKKNAFRFVLTMGLVSLFADVAYEGAPWPSADQLPNLRYLGVGPEPSQIIKDVPATADLVKLA